MYLYIHYWVLYSLLRYICASIVLSTNESLLFLISVCLYIYIYNVYGGFYVLLFYDWFYINESKYCFYI